MKGTFFQKPLELRLSVEGESWRQGERIQGSLTVKSHAADALALDGVSVCLARGKLKKVHEKSSGAFDVLEVFECASAAAQAGSKLEPQTELSFPWKFQTDRCCPITDTTASLFLLYGRAADPRAEGVASQLGHIEIPVLPDEVITHFLDLMKTGFRFVPKSMRWSKGSVDAKLAPPDARAFAALEQLTMSFSFEGEALQVRYHFKLKTVEASAASVELKKRETELERSYEPALYRTPSGRFDHERVEKEIRDVLGQIESKIQL